METKVCTKCKAEKPITEYRKRSDGNGTISACNDCERARGRAYQKRMSGTFEKAYSQQKSNAKARGVEFNISFEDWKSVWLESGKWADRGRGKGKYCMCRVGDSGAYEVGNVFIGLNEQNISDGNVGKVMADETKRKISEAHTGKTHDWSRGDKNPMHRPEVKAKMSAAIGGANHYNQRGVVTPEGYFVTAKAAAEALGIKKSTVEWRARHNKFGFSLPAIS